MQKSTLIFILIILSFIFAGDIIAKCVCSGVTQNYSESTCISKASTEGCSWSNSPSSGTVKLTNPLTGNSTPTTIPTLIGYAIKAVMGIVGSLALVMIIYGGFVWMTAAGNTEKVTQGKNILIWAIIGLVVIFSAYLLVSNIINVATTGNLSTPTQ